MAPSVPRANTSMYGPYAVAAGPEVATPPSEVQAVQPAGVRWRSRIAPSDVRRANTHRSFAPRDAAAGLSSYTSARAGALVASSPAAMIAAVIHVIVRLTCPALLVAVRLAPQVVADRRGYPRSNDRQGH